MTDLVKRLENLKQEIDTVKSLSIGLKANAKREEEIFRDIIKKIEDMGLDRKTIKDDIVNMERDIELKVSEKVKEVKEVKVVLEDIEKKVRLI